MLVLHLLKCSLSGVDPIVSERVSGLAGCQVKLLVTFAPVGGAASFKAGHPLTYMLCEEYAFTGVIYVCC